MVVVMLMVTVVVGCVWGGVGGCRCVLELERQGKVCMYIENEVGLGGTSGLKSQLTLYFHWRKKKHSNIQNQNKQTFKDRSFAPIYFLNIIRWTGEFS